MANTLSVKVSPRKEGQQEYYEGTVSICGVKPTKLCRKSDGSTRFATRSSVTGAARTLAQALGYGGVEFIGESTKSSTTSKTSITSKTPIVSKTPVKSAVVTQSNVSKTSQVKVAAKKAVKN